MRADITQNSRVTVAVARSRRKKQSLRGMRRRGTKKKFRMQNSQFTINGFSSKVRFHRCHSEEQSDEESVFVSFSRFPPFRRAGLRRGRPANIRLSPGKPRRLRPNPRQTYFVILSVSEGSIWGKVTDSSSIFRSPQNDNAVFALNHFLSGTHSSARPGRLRGSHLRCEPARAQGLPYQKETRACGTCLPLLSSKNLFWARLQILRRYAPQNDKLLNCSQTPQQTGICNWRQRGEVKGKDRCSERPQLAEINTGFSRASRSPALRRLAKLAPLASAREHLLYLYRNRARLRFTQRCEFSKQLFPNIPSRAITPPADC